MVYELDGDGLMDATELGIVPHTRTQIQTSIALS